MIIEEICEPGNSTSGWNKYFSHYIFSGKSCGDNVPSTQANKYPQRRYLT